VYTESESRFIDDGAVGGCEFTCQCPFTTARGWGSPIRLNPGAQPVPESGWGVPTYFAAHKPGPLGPLQAGPRPPAGRSASFQVGSVTASSKPPQPTSSLTFLCSPVPHPAAPVTCCCCYCCSTSTPSQHPTVWERMHAPPDSVATALGPSLSPLVNCCLLSLCLAARRN